MPPRRDPDATRSDKALRLFAKFFFNRRKYSLIELARDLQCSKQTVQRLVDTIETSMGIPIAHEMRGRRKYFWLARRERVPDVALLSIDELHALSMCHAFTEALLGREYFEEAARGLEKSVVLLPGENGRAEEHFSTLLSGHIDYTPHQEKLRSLIEAMEERRVCRVVYRRLLGKQAKTFHVKPLKIFSYRDALYLHAKKARDPGRPYREPQYDPLLAVHRMLEVHKTDRSFRVPEHYDFDRHVRGAFGVWQNEPFEVVCELRGWAAEYVAERSWSRDQRVEPLDDDRVRVTLTARGEPEILSWVLGFGEDARLISPLPLVQKLRDLLASTFAQYAGLPTELPSGEKVST